MADTYTYQLARAVVTAVAPEQLISLDEAAATWATGKAGASTPGRRGNSVGSGFVWGTLVYLVFPIIAGALGQVLGNQIQRGRPNRQLVEAVCDEIVRRWVQAGLPPEKAGEAVAAVRRELLRDDR